MGVIVGQNNFIGEGMTDFTIRKCRSEDASVILGFITELAVYEKAEQEVVASEQDIKDSLFGDGTTTFALICEVDNQPIGFAVYFYNYSTWLGKHGLYLEDLYITPSERGSGAGKALIQHLAQIAVEKKCGRFEWSVLDWNEPAIKFYESIGARPQPEWIGYRLSGQELLDFARG